ncbi:MAG: hypothetical protein AAFO84_03070 [Cyanobacteria bacterium J06598_1]
MNAAQRPVTQPSVTQPSTASAAITSQSALPSESRQLASASSHSAGKASAHYAPKRQLHAGARRAIAFESSVKLTVNLLLAIVATTTIAKLVPYYQNQQQRLSQLETSVERAEQKNAELRSQFNRNFDPTQAKRIMQEQSGLAYPNQKKVIWTEPLDQQ